MTMWSEIIGFIKCSRRHNFDEQMQTIAGFYANVAGNSLKL
ncbi:hypothetical protein [Alteromonas pelagimontana]|nr:hypothetical protein [Alteromonas pelagimontana]